MTCCHADWFRYMYFSSFDYILPLSYVKHIFLLFRYKSLEVKNILMESILHHILPQMLVSPLWTELNNLLKDYLKFMDDHFRESADLTFLAYRHRNYSKVCILDFFIVSRDFPFELNYLEHMDA